MKKKILLIILSIGILCFGHNVQAAYIGISASSRYPTVGSSITITVNANGLIGKFSVTSSNPSVLSGGTLGDWIEGGSSSYRFTAKSKGTATITFSALDAADSNGNPASGRNSITITVGEPVKKSTNNYLSSLSVADAKLSPEFNKDILAYSVELEAGTEKANITAAAADGNSTVEGVGEVEVEEGENTFEVKVTSESGSTRIYTLNINVKEFDPIEQKIGNKKYTIIRNLKKITPPAGYEESTIKIDGKEIPVFKSKITKYTLVGLKDSKGNQALYIYKDGKYTKYQEFTFSQISIVSLPLKKVPDGYKKTTIKLKDEKVDAYKTSASSKYALIYGMNLETGKKHLYRYDEEEGTIQIAPKEIETMSDQLGKYKLYIVILGSVAVFLLILSICFMIANHKYKMKRKHNIKARRVPSNEEK